MMLLVAFLWLVGWTISASVLLSRTKLSKTKEVLLLAPTVAIGVAPFSWFLVHFVSTGGAA